MVQMEKSADFCDMHVAAWNSLWSEFTSLWGREVGLAGVGWRDGEKMQTIVTE